MYRISLFCLLALLVGGVVAPVVAAAQPVLIAKGFRSQADLDAKFKQVKKGWTKNQVRQLLGDPQWSSTSNWNYFVDKTKDIKVIQFKGDRVSSFGGAAG